MQAKTLGKILLIDDEEKLRTLLQRILKLEGYQLLEAGSLKEGKKLLETESPDVILCDVKLPDGNGVDFVSFVRKQYASSEIILLTAFGNIPDGVQAMKNGAFDYITKGDDNDRIIPLLAKAMEKVHLQKRLRQLEGMVGKKYSFESIVGHSPAIRHAVELAQKVAPTEATVLLLGETGTGKEVFAQAIHHASNRRSNAFIALNCSAFTGDLLESELFGYKAGAFTGATKDKKGLIEEANGGTLFLDEIGEMPLPMQSKLLRVLESGEYIKVGDTRISKADVRLIAATNRNLEEEVNAKRFREDLFYRLNVFTILLPSLAERQSDIEEIATHYLKQLSARTNKQITRIQPMTLKHLQSHRWKGNVRELKNVLERAVILESSSELTPESLPFDIQQENNGGQSLDLATVEKNHIRKVLFVTNGNKTEAARLLGIGLTTLYRKLDEYDLSK